MRILNRLRRDEEGAVLVWVVIMMVALLGMGAIAIDAGYGFAVKRETSTAADASALAGAHAAAQKYTGNGCAGVVSEAESVANDMVDANDLPGEPTSNPAATCDSTHITVSMDAKTVVPTFLGPIIGTDSMAPHSSATAEVVGTYGGLRPLSICGNDAGFSSGIPGPGVHQTVYPKSSSIADQGTCGGASGNFGPVRFPDGNGSTPDLARWIRDGYTGADPLSIPGPIDGNTGAGFNQQVTGELDKLIADNTIILLPVYSGWSDAGGNGNNAKVDSVGVVSVRLCGYATSHKASDVGMTNDCWDQAKFLDPAQTPQDNPKFVFQWEYVDYVAPYVSGGTCPISICTPAVRLVK